MCIEDDENSLVGGKKEPMFTHTLPMSYKSSQ